METLQAEGGINVASIEWLKEIREICTEKGILMVCDDIQGRASAVPVHSFPLNGREFSRIWLSFPNPSAGLHAEGFAADPSGSGYFPSG